MLSVGTTGVKMRANVQDGLKKKNRQKPPLIMKKISVH